MKNTRTKNIFILTYTDHTIDPDFVNAFETLQDAVETLVDLAADEERYLKVKDVMKEATERNKAGFVVPYMEDDEDGYCISRVPFMYRVKA